ncbi:unnamed protein product [Chondrus crispus]|uniref:UDP-N-acetylglucosamine transferase subunit ALG13 n=1 Tax=Chondrus crispus TaxID=2769 RepID=R7QF63_CHOCR|nr:unnamed protein product [Chondrus crispus]CDF36408.1 unnamed protein product [Chondrus crispus]|eukprot:XP_005716227.1 unnamed protein product [Chondrus crispus]
MGLHALVTVGSTSFPVLTDYMLTSPALAHLHALGVHTLTVQHGAAALQAVPESCPLRVEAFPYTPDLAAHLDVADLVLSHAGAGTISEGLDKKKRMLVVVNDALMDNHQTELAAAMAERGCCVMITANQLRERFHDAAEKAINLTEEDICPPEKNQTAFAALLAQLICTYDES